MIATRLIANGDALLELGQAYPDPTGVAVVSTVTDAEPHAMTVNSFVTVSLDPLYILVSLSLTCRTYDRIRASGVFAVTVLGADQQSEAQWFASSRRGTGHRAFLGVDWRPAYCVRASPACATASPRRARRRHGSRPRS